jgi:hypothetical protein
MDAMSTSAFRMAGTHSRLRLACALLLAVYSLEPILHASLEGHRFCALHLEVEETGPRDAASRGQAPELAPPGLRGAPAVAAGCAGESGHHHECLFCSLLSHDSWNSAHANAGQAPLAIQAAALPARLAVLSSRSLYRLAPSHSPPLA